MYIPETPKHEYLMHNESIEALLLTYQVKPYIAEVKKVCHDVISSYRDTSQYGMFTPKTAIVYPYVYGWSRGWNAIIYDNDKIDADKIFYDEPVGKYSNGNRYAFNF